MTPTTPRKTKPIWVLALDTGAPLARNCLTRKTARFEALVWNAKRPPGSNPVRVVKMVEAK